MSDTPVNILVIDDDPTVALLVSAILKKDNYNVISAHDGEEVFSMLSKDKPSLILLDLKMPGIDGYAICREIRGNPKTRHTPVIILSAVSQTEAKVTCMDMGADDFITKPFDARELRARIKRTLKRKIMDVSLNPLTHLPGSPSIEEETQKRLRLGRAFAFVYADIDNFKAFNDAYGYARGDTIIRKLAEIFVKQASAHPDANIFIGHIGGDDFVLLSSAREIETIAGEITAEFDRIIPSFYDPNDIKHGYITTTDRKKRIRRFPIMTLSIAVVTPRISWNIHYAEIVGAAAEVKRYAKSMPGRHGSIFIKDRRMSSGEGPVTARDDTRHQLRLPDDSKDGRLPRPDKSKDGGLS